MPPPEKWHLRQIETGDGIAITICTENGEPFKSANTEKPLGRILEACKLKDDKYPCEGITISLLYGNLKSSMKLVGYEYV